MSGAPVGVSGIARTPESMAIPAATQQTSPILAGGFTTTDVGLVTALAIWSDRNGDLRRAAELQLIALRIERARAGVNISRWSLLEAGRVGAAAVRASRDPNCFITVEQVRPLTRRLTRLAVGEAFDIVSVIPAEG